MREYLRYIFHIIIEGSIVGIATVILGTIISYLYALLKNKDTKFIKNTGMYICLFLTGFILHVGWDIVGLNKWYCKNGYACL